MKYVIRAYVEVECPDDVTPYKIADQLFVTLRGVKRDLPEDLGKITDVAVDDPELTNEGENE